MLFNSPSLRPAVHVNPEPEPVTHEERQGIRDWIVSDAETFGDPILRRAAISELKIHEYKAFWGDLSIDEFGHYWLHIPRGYMNPIDTGGSRYRVLSPEGEYLGDTRWPSSVGRVQNGCLMTYIENEETGEREATVFRIVPAVDGLIYP